MPSVMGDLILNNKFHQFDNNTSIQNYNYKLMTTSINFKNKFVRASRFMALVCAFGIPWSNGFFNWGFYLMMIFFILGFRQNSSWREVLKNPAVIVALSMFFYIFLRTIISTTSWDFGRPDLFNYRKLLAIPIFISLFNTTAQKKQLAISYCLGVCVLMLPTLIDGFGYSNLIEHFSFFHKNAAYGVTYNGTPNHNFVYWRNQIAHGFHVSTLFTACILGAIYYRKHRFGLIALAFICALDLIFFIYGRMALLSLFFSMLAIALIFFHSKKNIATLIAITLLMIATAYVTIPSVKIRLSSIQTETHDYMANKDKAYTSAGLRLFYYKVSYEMFKESPIFGTGSGSFKQRLRDTKNSLADLGAGHTHDEYLTQLSMYGIIGLILFICLIWIALKNARLIEDKWLANFTTIAIAIFCLSATSDSSLHNDWEGWTFILFVSIACSKQYKTQYIPI